MQKVENEERERKVVQFLCKYSMIIALRVRTHAQNLQNVHVTTTLVRIAKIEDAFLSKWTIDGVSYGC